MFSFFVLCGYHRMDNRGSHLLSEHKIMDQIVIEIICAVVPTVLICAIVILLEDLSKP